MDKMECPNCKSQAAEQWIRPDESIREGYYYITCTTCGLVAYVEREPSSWVITTSLINKDIIGKTEISWDDIDEVEEKNEKVVVGEVRSL